MRYDYSLQKRLEEIFIKLTEMKERALANLDEDLARNAEFISYILHKANEEYNLLKTGNALRLIDIAIDKLMTFDQDLAFELSDLKEEMMSVDEREIERILREAPGAEEELE
uniref:Uncharacterized protein n=1 Tax=Sulfolobus neozealandicus TaxID=299422 RepID=Q5DVE1_9CREN|nr:hypothetical protein [Sulfolobus neozealandicus]